LLVLIMMSASQAVILKDYLFRWLRVSSDDYFTIGSTVGCIAGAIGTTSLVGSNPRAMATATVSFALFGLVLLVLVAVPSIASFVGSVAGFG